MGFGAGREKGGDLDEIAGDFAREIDDGEKRGQDDGFGGLLGGRRKGTEKERQADDGNDSQHGGRIISGGGEWQQGFGIASGVWQGYRRGMKLERVETPEQIVAVAALAAEIWVQHYVPIIGAAQVVYMLDIFQSPEAIARQIASEGYEYYLAPGAAYLALVPDGANKSMLLSKIYVRAALRGSGLGRALVEFAETRCAESGCRELWLTVNRNNAGSIAIYERMGFRKIRQVATDIGGGFVMDDWRMAKSVEKMAAPRQ